MLLFGVLHASAHSVPAFGYWQCFFLSFVVAGIVTSGVFNISQRVKALAPMYGKKKVDVQIDGNAVAEALLKYGRRDKGIMN